MAAVTSDLLTVWIFAEIEAPAAAIVKLKVNSRFTCSGNKEDVFGLLVALLGPEKDASSEK